MGNRYTGKRVPDTKFFWGLLSGTGFPSAAAIAYRLMSPPGRWAGDAPTAQGWEWYLNKQNRNAVERNIVVQSGICYYEK